MADAGANAEACKLAVTQEMPIGAHVSVPIVIGGETFGTFCFFSRKKNDGIDEKDLAVVKMYADFVGEILRQTVEDERLAEKQASQIRKIIDERMYYMVYQPIFHVEMRKLVGYEALTRFTVEPKMPPDYWFGVAENVGLQVELEQSVITRALEDFHHFPEDSYLSLNVSPQSALCDSVLELFEPYPLERIMLEVTEHASISLDDYEKIAKKLEPFRELGMKLAVDDAGAGYASFRHILKLKPDVIKLDSSLIAEIDKNEGMRALASSLVRFAEETNSKVVAEGVETEHELEVLRRLNVNKAQGYLLGHPKPIEALVTSFPF